MFQSRRRFSNRRSFARRSRRQRVPWIRVGIALVAAAIGLELAARAFLGVLGAGGSPSVNGPGGIPAAAYQLQFQTQDGRPIAGLTEGGNPIARRDPQLGYRLAGDQQSPFWQIGERGFRNAEPVPPAKPEDEIRVFILGGSAAFGQWADGNSATIAPKLEQQLNERVARQQNSPGEYRPDVLPFYKPTRREALSRPPKIREGNYRVINAAVPGHASSNQLARLALQVLSYQPDAIVAIDGYRDLLLPGDRQAADIPQLDALLADAGRHLRAQWGNPLQRWLQQTALVRVLGAWFSPSGTTSLSVTEATLARGGRADASLTERLPTQQAERQRRATRYRRHYQAMAQAIAGTDIPLVSVLQPEITGRSSAHRAPQEQATIDELGEAYVQRLRQGYARLGAANQQLEAAFDGVTALNLYQLYQDSPDRAFYDPIHLTERANAALAERLYQALAGLEAMQIVPENAELPEGE